MDQRIQINILKQMEKNQKKVHFKNLGLLIVDEEQRFGVKQKEKIRQLAAGVDVLTLSATPIRRPPSLAPYPRPWLRWSS